MNTSATKSEKTLNYTPAMVKILEDSQPLNIDKCKEIGASFDPPKSFRSVIAKAKSLELEYESKPKPTKKVAKVTKSELVTQISGYIDRDLDGLEKATAAALVAVINGIQHLMLDIPEKELPEIGDSAKTS